MSITAEQLEHALRRDLQRLVPRIDDQDLWEGLYTTLANWTWRHQGSAEGHVALSWKRTEELINDLRAGAGLPPMTLAQTGGEGIPDPTITGELDRLGWEASPLDTSRHDDNHLDSPEDEPRTPPNSPIPRR